MGENFQGENFNIYKYAKFGIQWDYATSGFELKKGNLTWGVNGYQFVHGIELSMTVWNLSLN